MMGRFMGFVPDIETLAPALGTTAAYGGAWALPITCRWLALSQRAVGPGFPLIGTNGARSGADILRFVLAGTSAGELLSVVMQSGFEALATARRELLEYLEKKSLNLRDLVGTAADRLGSYAEQPIDAGRWRTFVPVAMLE
jgi:Dihydroorotate dehydrogenase